MHPDQFKATQKYRDHVASKVFELKEICKSLGIPVIIACEIANDDSDTDARMKNACVAYTHSVPDGKNACDLSPMFQMGMMALTGDVKSLGSFLDLFRNRVADVEHVFDDESDDESDDDGQCGASFGVV